MKIDKLQLDTLIDYFKMDPTFKLMNAYIETLSANIDESNKLVAVMLDHKSDFGYIINYREYLKVKNYILNKLDESINNSIINSDDKKCKIQNTYCT